jgi:uncharacterized membrane protein YgdD (TMEM256/DUF423 family)
VPTVFAVFAGLMGAAGVILAAASAHLAPGSGLDSAANLLLFHAAALLGGTALLRQGVLWRPPALIAFAGWIVGAGLFSADIALRTLAGHRLFPMAAPSGGTLLIIGWIALALAGLLGFARIEKQ